jgi:hypothetical protein
MRGWTHASVAREPKAAACSGDIGLLAELASNVAYELADIVRACELASCRMARSNGRWPRLTHQLKSQHAELGRIVLAV